MLVEDLQRRHIEESLGSTLGPSKVTFLDEKIAILENQQEKETHVTFSFHKLTEKTREKVEITSSGYGFIDAVYSGLMREFSPVYRSLAQIKLEKFLISAPTCLNNIVASNIEVSLVFEISKNSFTFSHNSNSIIRSAYYNLLKTFEFYINCEKCFLMLRECVKEAKSRNRSDIISACSYKMSNLTKMISYEELCK